MLPGIKIQKYVSVSREISIKSNFFDMSELNGFLILAIVKDDQHASLKDQMTSCCMSACLKALIVIYIRSNIKHFTNNIYHILHIQIIHKIKGRNTTTWVTLRVPKGHMQMLQTQKEY